MTLLGETGPSFTDGSTWYPFSHHLLVTGESADANGGVWQLSPNPGGPVEKLAGFGFGGYEGIQADEGR